MTEAGFLLLKARKAAGLSQAELARRAAVPHSVLSAYERGKRDPGTRMLARLLAAAGYRLTLVGGPDPVRAGRTLLDVLELADMMPKQRRGQLAYPRLPGS